MRLTVKKVGVSMMMLATFFWGYMGISTISAYVLWIYPL